MSKTIGKNASKTNKVVTAKYFLTCINNLLSESRSLITPFGTNTVRQISISAVGQSKDTNRTNMEHLLLKSVNIGLKDISIFSARLGDKFIA